MKSNSNRWQQKKKAYSLFLAKFQLWRRVVINKWTQVKRLDSSEKDCTSSQQLATQRQRMGDYCILS